MTLATLANWTINHSGPLSSLGACEGLGWIKTKYANQSDDWPDIEFHFVAGTPVSDHGLGAQHFFYFKIVFSFKCLRADYSNPF